MARFARDILAKMRTKAKELEVILGPDTGELDLRIGIHSGQVTVSSDGSTWVVGPCYTSMRSPDAMRLCHIGGSIARRASSLPTLRRHC